MSHAMILQSTKLKILNAVVCFDPIAMMNNLSFLQWPANVFCHNKTMFQDIFALLHHWSGQLFVFRAKNLKMNVFIPSRCNAATLPSWMASCALTVAHAVASKRALPEVLPSRISLYPSCLVAKMTEYLNHGSRLKGRAWRLSGLYRIPKNVVAVPQIVLACRVLLVMWFAFIDWLHVISPRISIVPHR